MAERNNKQSEIDMSRNGESPTQAEPGLSEKEWDSGKPVKALTPDLQEIICEGDTEEEVREILKKDHSHRGPTGFVID